jgi:hypothetical protein
MVSAVNDNILANHVVITNLNIRLLTTEIKILRQGGNHRALMDLVVVTYTRAVADADKGEDDTVVTNHHIVLDIHKGEYLTVVANLRLWANLSFGTYFTCHILFVLGAQIYATLFQENAAFSVSLLKAVLIHA